jgi:hypothetical protein
MPNWNEKKYLELKLTKPSEQEVIIALRSAWKNLFHNYPSNETLAIIISQIMLETGRLKVMYNYNLGNVKSLPNDGHYWTMYKCSEILKGKEVFFEPPHDQCKFKAHKSLIEGAEFHIAFLNKPRYKTALDLAINKNVIGYTTELKRAGYFTANLSLYTNAMSSLYKEYLKKINLYNFSALEAGANKGVAFADQPGIMTEPSPLDIVIVSDIPPKQVSNDNDKTYDRLKYLAYLVGVIMLAVAGFFKC